MSPDPTSGYIRKAAVAGPAGFYPSNPELLRTTIQRYLDQTELSPAAGEIFGLVAPHAGYVFSGPVAAWAYRQIAGKSYEAVIIHSPLHR
jgi:AmmeMemoRadiSam system protein B